MNILTIIGNGFDLGHGLPTSFDAFIQSNPSVYPKKYATFRGGEGTWTRVEWYYGKQLCKILAERSWHDVTEVVEQIISDYGLNEYGEALSQAPVNADLRTAAARFCESLSCCPL